MHSAANAPRRGVRLPPRFARSPTHSLAHLHAHKLARLITHDSHNSVDFSSTRNSCAKSRFVVLHAFMCLGTHSLIFTYSHVHMFVLHSYSTQVLTAFNAPCPVLCPRLPLGMESLDEEITSFCGSAHIFNASVLTWGRTTSSCGHTPGILDRSTVPWPMTSYKNPRLGAIPV